MRPYQKILTYLVVAGGAVMFTLPLLWMISTALKPLEQTMSQPPRWLPVAHEVGPADARREVRVGAAITEPSVLALPAGASRPVVLAAASVRGENWFPQDGAPVPVTVLKTIPADPATPWREIVPLDDGVADVVPAASITTRFAPRWSNFPEAIAAMRFFPRYLANTVFLCVLNVVGTLLSCSLAAYGFSHLEWRGRDTLFGLALATMMIPFPVTMIPLYSLFRELGWVGTLKPLWVGAFLGNAFNIFLLRQFFRQIPRELIEAARIDGCGELRIFAQVILPLCKPALVVVGLFTFLGTWNDFLGPMIYITDQQDYTLALGLQFFQSQSGGTEWHYLMAASTLVTLPILACFAVAQRRFIEGISLSGLK